MTPVVRPDYPGSPTSFDFRNVQCESCHGPRAAHPKEKGVGIHLPTIAQCQRCHDKEHDPSFGPERFAKVLVNLAYAALPSRLHLGNTAQVFAVEIEVCSFKVAGKAVGSVIQRMNKEIGLEIV